MSTNNKVFQVLVPSGNKAVAAVGTPLSDLAEGQIGFFDENTKLAIDGSAITKQDKIFISVGRGNDIDHSAGQFIATNLIEDITIADAKDAVNQKQLIHGFTAIEPDQDYTVRFEVKNGKIAQVMGTVGYYKSFSFRTSIETNAKDFIKKMREALVVGIEPNSYFKATIVNADTLVEVTDIDGAADSVKFGVLIESLPVEETAFGSINPTYYKNRQSTIEISLLDTLADTGAKVEEKQASVNKEGDGYDVYQLEYQSLGWKNNHIYRVSCMTGLENPGAVYHVDKKINYNLVNIVYEVEGKAGWSSYKHPANTIIAIPKADTTTYEAVKKVVNNIAGISNVEVVG